MTRSADRATWCRSRCGRRSGPAVAALEEEVYAVAVCRAAGFVNDDAVAAHAIVTHQGVDDSIHAASCCCVVTFATVHFFFTGSGSTADGEFLVGALAHFVRYFIQNHSVLGTNHTRVGAEEDAREHHIVAVAAVYVDRATTCVYICVARRIGLHIAMIRDTVAVVVAHAACFVNFSSVIREHFLVLAIRNTIAVCIYSLTVSIHHAGIRRFVVNVEVIAHAVFVFVGHERVNFLLYVSDFLVDIFYGAQPIVVLGVLVTKFPCEIHVHHAVSIQPTVLKDGGIITVDIIVTGPGLAIFKTQIEHATEIVFETETERNDSVTAFVALFNWLTKIRVTGTATEIMRQVIVAEEQTLINKRGGCSVGCEANTGKKIHLGFAQRTQETNITQGEDHLHVEVLHFAAELEIVFEKGRCLEIAGTAQNSVVVFTTKTEGLRDGILHKRTDVPSWLDLVGVAEEESRSTAKPKRKFLSAAINEVAGHGILT